ncbi:putative cytochrome P450 [Glonium stellatum]|uniref:Putative cytochrome P450 n=1 Tax=Glonium stellatum TaxID=574774 RepID=A0A8E2FBU6_9PEZI|nr:putative cytochrome P450 [Glonium stellatum]
MAEFPFNKLLLAPYLIALVGCIIFLRLILSIGSRPKSLPPGNSGSYPMRIGPPTLPIIGNLHLLSKKGLHLAYQRWAEQYGPIFSVILGQQTIIVLASGDIIKKLIDKRSANYSDRQQLYMREIYEDSRIIMRGNDDLWRVERKLYHSFLNINVAKKYSGYQELETLHLCIDLLQDPTRFVDAITRTTTSLSASMTFGYRVTDVNSPKIRTMFHAAHSFFELVVQSKFLDWYPMLRPIFRKIPLRLNPFARKGTELYHHEREFFAELFKDGVARADERLPNILTDKAASYISGVSFEAGADTTRNTLIGFVKAMALFPEAQRAAQQEIDEIIGPNNLPMISDFDRLPYIRNTVKEVLRWMPTTILGAVPHSAKSDDEINGYKIPAGAAIVLGVWMLNNESQQFKDPRVFDPSRHDSSLTIFEAATAADWRVRDQYTFGAGRRMCPGMHVAEKTLFMSIARILWAFNISKAKESSGKEIYIEPDAVTEAIACCPLPFQCELKPRDEKRAELLRAKWSDAQNVLNEQGDYVLEKFK